MNDLPNYQFFATAPKGIESLVELELNRLGVTEVKQTRAGVSFNGNLEAAYKACLWLRTANRVLMPMDSFEARSPEMLYQGIKRLDWSEHFDSSASIAIDFNSNSSQIKHSQFGAQKVKDAIVDQFKEKDNTRPTVDLKFPDIRINVYVLRDMATVSIDLSGESLHKRGYRLPGVEAPLKENLAAALLLRADWENIASQGGGLVDPMCGTGTILIEAALIAASIAPGLFRQNFGFTKWKQHQPEIWDKLVAEADKIRTEGIKKIPYLVGFDGNSKAIANARESCEKLGFLKFIHLEKNDLANCRPHPKMGTTSGLFFANPPYGVRLGEKEELKHLYSNIGIQLKKHFSDWHASIFTGDIELGKKIGIRSHKKYSLYNGSIPCTLLNFRINEDRFMKPRAEVSLKNSIVSKADVESAGFRNRIRKNLKKLKPWLIKENIECYRVYDKDIPEFAVSIDVYGNHLHVQEYKAPESVDQNLAQKRLDNILESLIDSFEVPKSQIHLKVRQQQKGKKQYQKHYQSDEFYEVVENKNRFLVNFTDYLDTGLFLDHRITRQLICDRSKGARFLNLFSYTGTASVYAAKGGARQTVSVDSSKKYNSWARKNLSLNGYSESNHEIVTADCIEWLSSQKHQFDLIFLDPPTFSNSKTRETIFDLQKNHSDLIRKVMKLLKKDGTLIFSNNYRRFKMDFDELSDFKIKDITKSTIPPDFFRNPKIHNCWEINK